LSLAKPWPSKIKDPKLVREYKRRFPYCELTFHLTGIRNEIPIETHHVLPGSYRSDEIELIVNLRKYFHDLQTENRVSPIQLFGLKCLKGEVGVDRFLEYAQLVYRRAIKQKTKDNYFRPENWGKVK